MSPITFFYRNSNFEQEVRTIHARSYTTRDLSPASTSSVSSSSLPFDSPSTSTVSPLFLAASLASFFAANSIFLAAFSAALISFADNSTGASTAAAPSH